MHGFRTCRLPSLTLLICPCEISMNFSYVIFQTICEPNVSPVAKKLASTTWGVVMTPNLISLVTPQIVDMAICGTVNECKQLLSITLLSTQDGGRHSGQGRLQRLFLTSVHISKGYLRPSDSLQHVGFSGFMCWSIGLFSGRNRAV